MCRKVNSMINISKIISILFAAIGLTLIIFPTMSLLIISYSISFILIVKGFQILNNNIKNDILPIGITLLGLGIINLLFPAILNSFFLILLGCSYIVSGMRKIQSNFKLNNSKHYMLIIIIICSTLEILSGLTLLFKIYTATFITNFSIGLILIVYSISSLINNMLIKENINHFIKFLRYSCFKS